MLKWGIIFCPYICVIVYSSYMYESLLPAEPTFIENPHRQAIINKIIRAYVYIYSNNAGPRNLVDRSVDS